MIRLLIWVGVVLALLGFFYMSRRRRWRPQGRAATRERTARRQGHDRVPAPSSPRRCLFLATRRSLPDLHRRPPSLSRRRSAPPPHRRSSHRSRRPSARRRARASRAACRSRSPTQRACRRALLHLACHGEPHADRPAASRLVQPATTGDTSCRTVLPIACYRSSGAAAPPSLAQDFYKRLDARPPRGDRAGDGRPLESESSASARCEAELGAGWRDGRVPRRRRRLGPAGRARHGPSRRHALLGAHQRPARQLLGQRAVAAFSAAGAVVRSTIANRGRVIDRAGDSVPRYAEAIEPPAHREHHRLQPRARGPSALAARAGATAATIGARPARALRGPSSFGPRSRTFTWLSTSSR